MRNGVANMKKTTAAILTFVAMMTVAAPTVRAQSPEAAAQSSAEQKALFRRGARLWPMYCSQCHKPRSGAEFSPAQWDTVMMHMRARANFTGEDARALLVYLQAR